MQARTSTVAIAVTGLMLCVGAALGASPYQATSASQEQPQRIAGAVLSVERLPNRPGYKCGHHFDLVVSVAGRGRKVLHVYDMGVAEDDLVALRGRSVEIDVVAGAMVQGIRAAGAAVAGLSSLSTIKHC
jgi:hypothetical protein